MDINANIYQQVQELAQADKWDCLLGKGDMRLYLLHKARGLHDHDDHWVAQAFGDRLQVLYAWNEAEAAESAVPLPFANQESGDQVGDRRQAEDVSGQVAADVSSRAAQ